MSSMVFRSAAIRGRTRSPYARSPYVSSAARLVKVTSGRQRPSWPFWFRTSHWHRPGPRGAARRVSTAVPTSFFDIAISRAENTINDMELLGTKAALIQALVSGEGYGLELIERIRAASRGSICLKEGAIYPALRSMEAEGLVRHSKDEPTAARGGRPRRYYQLTAAGRRVAVAQARSLHGVLAASTLRPVGAK